jgi:hypothetical protein
VEEPNFVQCIIGAGVTSASGVRTMSDTRDRAKRYRDRAEECLRILASAQTPGSGEIHLMLAHYNLMLAELEKSRRLTLSGDDGEDMSNINGAKSNR